MFSLWEVENITLDKIFAKDFTSTEEYNFVSALVTLVNEQYYLVVTSWYSFSVLTLSNDLTAIDSWRVWEYNDNSNYPTFTVVGFTSFFRSDTDEGALFFAAQGQADLTLAKSSIIFRHSLSS